MAEADGGPDSTRWRRALERYGRRAVVKAADQKMRSVDLERKLKSLGRNGPIARRLDDDVEASMHKIVSLSSLTSPLALDYVQRLSRPTAGLTPEIGVQVVARSYLAHLLVEQDPQRYGATDIPVLGTLPPLKKGRPPQDILSLTVKASRRNFAVIRAVSTPVWDGFVKCLIKRVHALAEPDEGYIAGASVDGLARFGWVLRQVDIHYQLEPERS